MIDYISGKISELTPTMVVIDNNGIGYSMEISLQTYAALEGKANAAVFVQRQVNQRDGNDVDYGFSSKEERELFRHITSVSGMGAASARMILSSLSSEEFKSAVMSEDVNRLKSIKGIGLKSAQRLILELKDKVFTVEGDTPSELFVGEKSPVADEASSALQMLGFSKPAVAKVVQAILKETPQAKVEDIIKLALKRL